MKVGLPDASPDDTHATRRDLAPTSPVHSTSPLSSNIVDSMDAPGKEPTDVQVRPSSSLYRSVDERAVQTRLRSAESAPTVEGDGICSTVAGRASMSPRGIADTPSPPVGIWSMRCERMSSAAADGDCAHGPHSVAFRAIRLYSRGDTSHVVNR